MTGRRQAAPKQGEDFFEQVYDLVRRVPRGRVVSYGQVARLLGKTRGARSVGWAMRALPPASRIPWQRVVNARGEVSLGGRSGDLQRALLESEGIEFDADGRIPMARFGWDPEVTPRRLPDRQAT